MKKLILSLMLLAPMTLFAQKFGHIDTEAFMKTVPEYTAAVSQLQAKATELDKQLSDMQSEIQRQYEDYQKNESTMNQTKKEEVQKTLDDLMSKYQQAQQDNTKTFNEERQKLLSPIQNKLVSAIESVAKAGGYVYIMEKSAGQPLYVNDAISKDVTNEVKVAYDKLK